MPVTFGCALRPVQARDLFALVDVEVLIGGMAFDIFGVQAHREPDYRTSVPLPTASGDQRSGCWTRYADL